MANPQTYAVFSTDNGDVLASCQFTLTAAGAVGSVKRSREMKATPVTHPGTGRYVFNFTEIWPHLEYADAKTIQASFSTAGSCHWELRVNNIAVDGTVELNSRKGTDFTLVDPASGDIVKAWFRLQKLVVAP